MNLFDNPITPKSIERDIDAELKHHVDLLIEEHVARGLSRDRAQELARRRFGNLEDIRSECVAIRRGNTTLVRLLKIGLIALFFAGVFVRLLGTEVDIIHMGQVMMLVALLGRLFLYVRSLRPPKSVVGARQLSKTANRLPS